MIYELRSYIVNEGKMPLLKARFGNVTMKFFEKHGIKSVGYWTNAIGGRSDEFLYMLAYEDMGHRERAWQAFQDDPDWQKARADSQADGAFVHYVENRFLTPTDYSPLR